MTDVQLEEATAVAAVLDGDIRYADGHLDAFGAGVLGAIPVVAEIKFTKQGYTPEELMTSTRKGMDKDGNDKLFPQAMQLIWSAWAITVEPELSAEEALVAYKTLARGNAGHLNFRDAVKQGWEHVLQLTEDKHAQSAAVREANAALRATPTMVLARIDREIQSHLALGIHTDADRKKAQALANALLAACK